MSDSTRTVATRLTASAPSAITVVEVAGPRSAEVIQSIWIPNQGTQVIHKKQLRYGYVVLDVSEGETSQESVVVYRKSCDEFEVHCHGGPAIFRALMRTLNNRGVDEQLPSGWIAAHAKDAIEAEATEDLLGANTLKVAAHLMAQRNGALSNAFARVESLISNQQFGEALAILERLEQLADIGMHLTNPRRVVLAGPPNVGKSSLLNRLLGYSRAIVHEQPGTTRDLLHEATSLDGWPVVLIDSAGVRETTDSIEQQGVERAWKTIETADRILLLIDPQVGWTDVHRRIYEHFNRRCLLVATKADLNGVSTAEGGIPRRANVLRTSSSTGLGIEHLMRSLAMSWTPSDLRTDEPIPFRQSHLKIIASLKNRCG